VGRLEREIGKRMGEVERWWGGKNNAQFVHIRKNEVSGDSDHILRKPMRIRPKTLHADPRPRYEIGDSFFGVG
jgi:hypothetical protein